MNLPPQLPPTPPPQKRRWWRLVAVAVAIGIGVGYVAAYVDIPYYTLGPGPAKVHLRVKFNWDMKQINDVIARIPGASEAAGPYYA